MLPGPGPPQYVLSLALPENVTIKVHPATNPLQVRNGAFVNTFVAHKMKQPTFFSSSPQEMLPSRN